MVVASLNHSVVGGSCTVPSFVYGCGGFRDQNVIMGVWVIRRRPIDGIANKIRTFFVSN